MKYWLLSLVRSSQITHLYAMEIAACLANVATAFILLCFIWRSFPYLRSHG